VTAWWLSAGCSVSPTNRRCSSRSTCRHPVPEPWRRDLQRIQGLDVQAVETEFGTRMIRAEEKYARWPRTLSLPSCCACQGYSAAVCRAGRFQLRRKAGRIPSRLLSHRPALLPQRARLGPGGTDRRFRRWRYSRAGSGANSCRYDANQYRQPMSAKINHRERRKWCGRFLGLLRVPERNSLVHTVEWARYWIPKNATDCAGNAAAVCWNWTWCWSAFWTSTATDCRVSA